MRSSPPVLAAADPSLACLCLWGGAVVGIAGQQPWFLAAAAAHAVAWMIVRHLQQGFRADPLWRRATARLQVLLVGLAAAGLVLAGLGAPVAGAWLVGSLPGALALLALALGSRAVVRAAADR